MVFLHGGPPGGGAQPAVRQFFDPAAYRIVLLDQRGCGRSTPPHVADGADLSVNTTDKLLADIEALREHLSIDKWMVFGGSWGSTLSIAYAETFPTRVTELVLRGIFLLRRSEIDWYYNGGAGNIFPERWDKFLEPVPEAQRGEDLVAVYHQLLHSEDPRRRSPGSDRLVGLGRIDELPVPTGGQDRTELRDPVRLAFARIENHYFVNGGFFDENQLLRKSSALHGIPGTIVQGRYDVVCPATSAWALHKAWPESKLVIVDDAGHSAMEPGIMHHLVEATDSYR